MFNHILIPTDCTQIIKHALDLAINMKIRLPLTEEKEDMILGFRLTVNSLQGSSLVTN